MYRGSQGLVEPMLLCGHGQTIIKVICGNNIPNWSLPFLILMVLSRAAGNGGMSPKPKRGHDFGLTLGEGTGDACGEDMPDDGDVAEYVEIRSLVVTAVGGM